MMVAVVFLAGGAGFAQQEQPSALDRAAAASRRGQEYQELLRSPDAALRATGLEQGLTDENLGVRSMVLTAYLRRLEIIPVEVVVQPAGRFTVGDMPNLTISELKWASDGSSFLAVGISWGAGLHPRGQVVGDKLIISYGIVRMSSHIAAEGPPPQRNSADYTCRVTLSPAVSHDALEGSLQCEGLPFTLPVRLPLG
jgi:hypothetical protein